MAVEVELPDGSMVELNVNYIVTERFQISEGTNKPDGVYVEEGTIFQFSLNAQDLLLVKSGKFTYRPDPKLIAELMNTKVIAKL